MISMLTYGLLVDSGEEHNPKPASRRGKATFNPSASHELFYNSHKPYMM